jgi:nucleoside-diphosphate-sugar epimerase
LRVLVTGANGFLGQAVVAALRARGHQVRALVRPTARLDHLDWSGFVEVVRADLRVQTIEALAAAFDGIDALVHLAALVQGTEEAQFAATVVGTERLLSAMARTTTRRLVLASSFSVYDWSAIRGTLTEESPLAAESYLYQRDGYAIAKVWQERVARHWSKAQGGQLTVLRPGFVWGPGHEYLAGLGQKIGRAHLVFGPRTRLPLTFVENCADCFVEATTNPRAIGETFNVVDGDEVRVWRYLGEYLRRGAGGEGAGGRGGYRVPLPYSLAFALVRLAHRGGRWVFGPEVRLPGLFVPCRFEARFKPLRFSDQKLRAVLGWQPPLSFEECLRRTYGEIQAATPRPAPEPLMRGPQCLTP